jgi:hypothetical protein
MHTNAEYLKLLNSQTRRLGKKTPAGVKVQKLTESLSRVLHTIMYLAHVIPSFIIPFLLCFFYPICITDRKTAIEVKFHLESI